MTSTRAVSRAILERAIHAVPAAIHAVPALLAATLWIPLLAASTAHAMPGDPNPPASAAVRTAAARTAACQDCHTTMPSAEAFAKTAHHKSKCNDCHIGAREDHGTRDGERFPDVEIETIGCLDCHLLQSEQLGNSVHGGLQIPALATEAAGKASTTEDEDEDEEDAVATAAARNCVVCHDVHNDPKKSDPLARHSRNRSAELCGQCHRPEPEVATLPENRGDSAFPNWSSSIHGCRLASGSQDSATCTDCHGSHAILALEDPAAPVQRRNVPETCGTCHEKETRSFLASVHGQALVRGASLAPSCTDCHGIHSIGPVRTDDPATSGDSDDPVLLASIGFGARALVSRDPDRGPVSSRQGHETRRGLGGGEPSEHVTSGRTARPVLLDASGASPTVESPACASPEPSRRAELRSACVRCHSHKEIEREYGISTDWVATWASSFHGLASRAGSVAVADCVSCHGAHDVLPSKDPGSRVHPSRVVETCASCHPGASANFAGVPVHGALSETPAGLGPSLPSRAKLLYLLLIPAVIGLMLLHNGLDLTARLRRAWRLRRRGPGRWSRAQWLQYGWFAAAFSVLAITGFAHLYPDAWWVRLLGITERVRAPLHRCGAVALLSVVIFHAGWIARTRGGRAFARGLLPRARDLRDILRAVGNLLCLRVPAEGARAFTYVEKSDYWAALWGSLVMGATGLALWFETITLSFAPGWAFEVARIVHLGEASLAVLAVVVWHVYPVVVRPMLRRILAERAGEEASAGAAGDTLRVRAAQALAAATTAPHTGTTSATPVPAGAGDPALLRVIWSFAAALRHLDPRTLGGFSRRRPEARRPLPRHGRKTAAHAGGGRRGRRRASSHPRPVRRGQRAPALPSTVRSARGETETHGSDVPAGAVLRAPAATHHPDRAAPLDALPGDSRPGTSRKESSR